ncbi:hypothetical protein [Nocardioides convexus]|uniref:hypothetical protein n=1 Tax=Nocardioides convexus TaxID=2712224 RepID=UPI0024182A30|nr:hypothetical protein [Nocardioides convexus]
MLAIARNGCSADAALAPAPTTAAAPRTPTAAPARPRRERPEGVVDWSGMGEPPA